MSRRSVLSATERASLLALPDTPDDLIRHYTFNESDLTLIRQRRGDANRLGFAVQLCLLRYPGYALTAHVLETLRQRKVIPPTLSVIERACAEAITRANRSIYRTLAQPLTALHRQRLDELLKIKPGSNTTWLVWLRQSPLKPNSRYMLEHIARLKTFQAIALPDDMGRHIHQNRLLKIAREGGQMTPQDLGKFETERRYATLVALTLEGAATLIDEIIDLHDRILLKLFSAAKHKHQHQFQQQGKAINDKVRLLSKIGHALLDAKQSESDPYTAIESVISWDDFQQSIIEADQLVKPAAFDHLHLIAEQFSTLRRYTPDFLDVLTLRAAPAAQDVLDAIAVIRTMNSAGTRKVPIDAPTAFIKPRWKSLVHADQGLDRRFYEICALTELKNALRSGDIWVQGSRQFRDFDEYLLPSVKFQELKQAKVLPVAVNPDSEQYLHDRLQLLERQLSTVNRLALANELPDTIITDSGLERAVEKLRELDKPIDDALLQYLSPLGWEHINLTGDYIWRQSRKIEEGQFRPLRTTEKS